ncbi:MAG: hypothetical protein IK151_02640 [Erysipelotrichaceae bacterium]|nr:hypothetical protein [Erysipelotrichaceae bacterium]
MIKNGFEKLNGDNWLAKEIERENRVSAWDFDEGKNLRNEHAQDCDAKGLRLAHEENCEAREVADEHSAIHSGRKTPNDNKISIWFVIDTIFLVLIMMLNLGTRTRFYYPTLVLFLGLNPGIFIWILLFKRMPPSWYLILLLIITLLLEYYGLFLYRYRLMYF